MSYEAAFWDSPDETHQKIVRAFDEHRETRHPARVTSRRMCPCLNYCSWCGWAGTTVEYPTYTGPRVQNIS